MEENVFYENGLDFSCRQCSRCCRFEGGAVLLSREDLNSLAQWAQLTPEQFIKVYCRFLEDDSGTKYLCLRDKNKSDCTFWNNGCEAYSARPAQCRSYPFWTKILSSQKAWDNESKVCPGINCGEHHCKNEIEKELSVYKSRIPLTE